VFQVSEDQFEQQRIFDAGNHSHRSSAFTAGLDIDVEEALQA
jgi:hypothetical protein